MKPRSFLGALTIIGGSVSLGLSLVFFFGGEFEKAQVMVLYTILSCLMISER